MSREVDQEDVVLDMTPMIDVVFLLIIFFILMPPKEMEGQLQSYLPSTGQSKDQKKPDEPTVIFTVKLDSKESGKDEISTSVTFNTIPICVFKTLSIPALNRIYKLPKDKKEKRLDDEYKRDEEQFNPALSADMRNLISHMVDAAEGAPKKRETDVMIDADSNVPFKIVLSILNAGAGAKFTNLKFAAPDRSIFQPD